MEIMVRATLTVTRKKKTVETSYGFAPDAGEKLKMCLSSRFTQAQAIRILGISESKFRNDRKAGKVRQNGDERKPWFKGMDLHQYWHNETRGDLCSDYVMRPLGTKGRREKGKGKNQI